MINQKVDLENPETEIKTCLVLDDSVIAHERSNLELFTLKILYYSL